MEKAQEADAAGGPDGLLLIDKPAGLTSHDVVLIARRAYGQRSIGHLGTLDPFATGLLVLLLGRSTRLANFLDIEPKVYEAVIRFGTETDSDDSTGAVTRTAPLLAVERIRQEVAMLTGRIRQVPPDYSAKSVDGERAYKAARKGTPMVQQPVTVTVHSWEIGELTGDSLPVTITCGGGTYIRALARDLGRAVGSAAHLESLRRISMGSLNVRDAMSVEQLKTASVEPRTLQVVVSRD
ncbi:MAG: tRNA pseudouridine(55) synthase TruB [Gemmatimonadota bacterium]|nr:tRNA pseudouridine(55) synthase TruB [Gemmatimonadota bacterium]